jgi:hypothetical protein
MKSPAAETRTGILMSEKTMATVGLDQANAPDQHRFNSRQPPSIRKVRVSARPNARQRGLLSAFLAGSPVRLQEP